MVPESSARAGNTGFALGRNGTRRTPGALAVARQPHEAAPQADARRERVSLALWRAGVVAPAFGPALYLRLCGAGTEGIVPACRKRIGHVRGQLELARSHLVSSELFDHRIAPKISSLLRRRLSRGMPDRLGGAAFDRR